MLTQTITDARAWRSDTLDDRRSWYYPLSPRCLAALDETMRELREQPRPTTELCAAELPVVDCAEEFRPVRSALENGRGFAKDGKNSLGVFRKAATERFGGAQ